MAFLNYIFEVKSSLFCLRKQFKLRYLKIQPQTTSKMTVKYFEMGTRITKNISAKSNMNKTNSFSLAFFKGLNYVTCWKTLASSPKVRLKPLYSVQTISLIDPKILAVKAEKIILPLIEPDVIIS